MAESNQQRALQITRTNDNRWALITGNGYNSANELPALLIQYLDSTKELKIIPTDATACPASAGIKKWFVHAPIPRREQRWHT